jgi:regulatory protein
MLGRRELSEAQVRERLGRKGFEDPDVDEAVDRLKAERAIDDARVAAAIARSETGARKRGPLRVRQRLAAARISPVIADAIIGEIAGQVDLDALLIAALDRRLRGRETVADDREMARLYRQLTAQGFERDRVLRLLRARRPE